MAETLSLDPTTIGRHALINETPSTAQTEVIPVVPRQFETTSDESGVRTPRQHVRPTRYFPVASMAVLGIIAASSIEKPTAEVGSIPRPSQDAPPPYIANVPVMSNETHTSTIHEPALVTGAAIAKLHTK